MRKRRSKPLLERVRIEDIAAEGKSLARIDGKVLFVPFTIPGDVVDVQLTKKRKSYMEGFVTAYHELSKDRIEPFCEHFGTCGGCKWQSLPYDLQLKQKQIQVEDQLSRIGKLQLPKINTILGSENTQYYRNKLEFTFSHSRWLTRGEVNSDDEVEQYPVLGFHVPGKFDKVFDLHTCYLQPAPSDAIRRATCKFGRENGFSFYNIREHQGFLRNLIVRTSSTGDVMVILVVGVNDTPKVEMLLNHLAQSFSSITSLLYVVNPKVNDTIHDLDVITFKGADYIMEEMEGIKFKVGPKSFYQTNSQQAYELYKLARSYASLKGDELVYDLYTGTGTIANFLAKSCKKVIGIEYVPEAIEDAKVNSKINRITNTAFFAGDMKDVLTEPFFKDHGYPDVVILDPPRAGMHPKVAERIREAKPSKIVYVSCNPASQARDINLLGDGFKVTKVQPVDMFPHTHHLENVVLLERCDEC